MFKLSNQLEFICMIVFFFLLEFRKLLNINYLIKLVAKIDSYKINLLNFHIKKCH